MLISLYGDKLGGIFASKIHFTARCTYISASAILLSYSQLTAGCCHFGWLASVCLSALSESRAVGARIVLQYRGFLHVTAVMARGAFVTILQYIGPAYARRQPRYQGQLGSARRRLRVSSVRPFIPPSVRPSVTSMYRGHIGWTSSKLIARIISLGSSLLGATTSAT